MPDKKRTGKARTKITQGRHRTAKDFMNHPLDLGNGIKLSGKLRVGGMQYLEDKYDCSILDINWETGRIRELVTLLVAMIIGDYPAMPHKEAEELVSGLDINLLNEAMAPMQKVLTTQRAGSEKKKLRSNPKTPPTD